MSKVNDLKWRKQPSHFRLLCLSTTSKGENLFTILSKEPKKKKKTKNTYVPPHHVHPLAPVQQNASSLMLLALPVCQATWKTLPVTFHTVTNTRNSQARQHEMTLRRRGRRQEEKIEPHLCCHFDQLLGKRITNRFQWCLNQKKRNQWKLNIDETA